MDAIKGNGDDVMMCAKAINRLEWNDNNNKLLNDSLLFCEFTKQKFKHQCKATK
jgi:hypothetical protein